MTDRLLAHDASLKRLQALHPKRIDLTLDRMHRVCRALGHPEHKLPPVIHVAGTNGKGSTVAFLRAMLEAAHKRIHVYTSPHLVRFCERIRLNGQLINEDYLSDCLTRVEDANGGQPLTFFEATTAAAFLAFSETPADYLILEVGLGGILDATNIIDRPLLSILTPIALDHQSFLGDDLYTIATQKAGIIKPNAPVICAEQDDEALRAIDRAVIKSRTMLRLKGRDFDARIEQGKLVYEGEDCLLEFDPPRLLGVHQIENAALAIKAALSLQLPQSAINQGLKAVRWPARLQPLTEGPLVAALKNKGSVIVLDGGHNPHAAKALVNYLTSTLNKSSKALIMILGLLNTKDSAGFLQILAPLKPRLYCVPVESEAALDPAILCEQALSLGFVADIADSPLAAIHQLGDKAYQIVIAGSLYLAGEVLGLDPKTYPY